jgi:subtilase family serine protease
MRFWKFLLPLLASTLAFAAQPDRILSTIDSSQAVALTKSLHPKAQPQYDQGAVDPSFKLSYVTLLTAPSPSQQKALDQLLAQQQDPKSPNYHKWLTPAQFADRFGLSRNDLNKVTAWLKSQGFQILSTGGGRNAVIFSGNAGQVRSALGAEIHHYNVNGEQHIANSTPIMIPAALNGIAHTVIGLHDFGPHAAYRGRGVGGVGGLRPDYFDSVFGAEFLAPGDISTIYDIPASADGTGQKIAVVGRTDIYLSDINDFRNGFGLTPIPTGSGGCTTDVNGVVISPCTTTNFAYVLVGTTHSISANDIGEADLDVEWSGAVARNAQIIYINSQTPGNVNDALIAAINSPGPPLATVVSMSFGICELFATDLESTLQQGNIEGVTIVSASGDQAAATCDHDPPAPGTRPFQPAIGGLAVIYPASSPEVTGVGGTEISIADDAPGSFWGTSNGSTGGSALKYIPEIPWNDDEELALFCQGDPTNGFCTQAPTPPPGWVTLTATATAAQVQEDIWLSGGGGGASNCFVTSNTGVCTGGAGGTGAFAQPLYQQSLSVPNAPAGVRYVPDVSLFASPNFPGYIFCTPANPSVDSSTCAGGIASAVENFQSLVGGTSVSAPVFAGIVALLNQFLSQTGQGNLNTALYALAATPGNNAFHPITTGDNNVFCQAGQPSVQPSVMRCPGTSGTGVMGYSASNADLPTGYNLVNGLGSVDASVLFNDLAAPPPSFTVAPNPASLTAAAGQISGPTTITVTPANGFNSAVTFSCTGLPTGATCSFNPTSSATSTQLTVQTSANMAVGSPTFSVKGSSGSLSSSTTVTLNVTATTESFTLATSPANATLSVAPGATSGNTVNLTLTDPGNTGFIVNNSGTLTTALPLTYTCTIVLTGTSTTASEAGCSVSPTSPTSVVNPTVSVQTTAPTVQLRPPFQRGSGIFYAMLLPGLFSIVFAAGSGKRGARLLSLIVVLSFSTLWLGACGGSGSTNNNKNPGTPAGSYTVNISATTGGASPITASTSFMLTVQ